MKVICLESKWKIFDEGAGHDLADLPDGQDLWV
jgi:hypothetical protein